MARTKKKLQDEQRREYERMLALQRRRGRGRGRPRKSGEGGKKGEGGRKGEGGTVAHTYPATATLSSPLTSTPNPPSSQPPDPELVSDSSLPATAPIPSTDLSHSPESTSCCGEQTIYSEPYVHFLSSHRTAVLAQPQLLDGFEERLCKFSPEHKPTARKSTTARPPQPAMTFYTNPNKDYCRKSHVPSSSDSDSTTKMGNIFDIIMGSDSLGLVESLSSSEKTCDGQFGEVVSVYSNVNLAVKSLGRGPKTPAVKSLCRGSKTPLVCLQDIYEHRKTTNGAKTIRSPMQTQSSSQLDQCWNYAPNNAAQANTNRYGDRWDVSGAIDNPKQKAATVQDDSSCSNADQHSSLFPEVIQQEKQSAEQINMITSPCDRTYLGMKKQTESPVKELAVPISPRSCEKRKRSPNVRLGSDMILLPWHSTRKPRENRTEKSPKDISSPAAKPSRIVSISGTSCSENRKQLGKLKKSPSKSPTGSVSPILPKLDSIGSDSKLRGTCTLGRSELIQLSPSQSAKCDITDNASGYTCSSSNVTDSDGSSQKSKDESKVDLNPQEEKEIGVTSTISTSEPEKCDINDLNPEEEKEIGVTSTISTPGPEKCDINDLNPEEEKEIGVTSNISPSGPQQCDINDLNPEEEKEIGVTSIISTSGPEKCDINDLNPEEEKEIGVTSIISTSGPEKCDINDLNPEEEKEIGVTSTISTSGPEKCDINDLNPEEEKEIGVISTISPSAPDQCDINDLNNDYKPMSSLLEVMDENPQCENWGSVNSEANIVTREIPPMATSDATTKRVDPRLQSLINQMAARVGSVTDFEMLENPADISSPLREEEDSEEFMLAMSSSSSPYHSPERSPSSPVPGTSSIPLKGSELQVLELEKLLREDITAEDRNGSRKDTGHLMEGNLSSCGSEANQASSEHTEVSEAGVTVSFSCMDEPNITETKKESQKKYSDNILDNVQEVKSSNVIYDSELHVPPGSNKVREESELHVCEGLSGDTNHQRGMMEARKDNSEELPYGQRTRDPAPLSVFSTVESLNSPKAMSAFISENLNSYLQTKENWKISLASKENVLDIKEDSTKNTPMQTMNSDDSKQEMSMDNQICQSNPDFDEVDGMLFVSFDSKVAMQAHIRIEKQNHWDDNNFHFLDMCKLHKAANLKKQLGISGKLPSFLRDKAQNFRGIHMKWFKYLRLYKKELGKLTGKPTKMVYNLEKSLGKTSDVTKLKGWQNRCAEDNADCEKLEHTEELSDALTVQQKGKLHWRTEQRLLRSFAPEDIKEMGLELKKKRRKNMVFTHRKGSSAKFEGRVGRFGRVQKPRIGQNEYYYGDEAKYYEDDSESKAKRTEIATGTSDSSTTSGIILKKLSFKKKLMKKYNLCGLKRLKKICKRRMREGKLASLKKIEESEVFREEFPILTEDMVWNAVSALEVEALGLPSRDSEDRSMKENDLVEKIVQAENLEDHVPVTQQCSEMNVHGIKMVVNLADRKQSSCGKPGCRYGCVCHLVKDKVVLGTKSSDSNDVAKDAPNVKCDKEYCRLGCICSSLDHQMDERTSHCGKAECIFECQCESKEFALHALVSPGRDSSDDIPLLYAVTESMKSPESIKSPETSICEATPSQIPCPELTEVEKAKKTKTSPKSKFANLPKRVGSQRVAKNLDAITRKAMMYLDPEDLFPKPKRRRRKKEEISLEKIVKSNPLETTLSSSIKLPPRREAVSNSQLEELSKGMVEIVDDSLDTSPEQGNFGCARTSMFNPVRQARCHTYKEDENDNTLIDVVSSTDSPEKLLSHQSACRLPTSQVTVDNVIYISDSEDTSVIYQLSVPTPLSSSVTDSKALSSSVTDNKALSSSVTDNKALSSSVTDTDRQPINTETKKKRKRKQKLEKTLSDFERTPEKRIKPSKPEASSAPTPKIQVFDDWSTHMVCIKPTKKATPTSTSENLKTGNEQHLLEIKSNCSWESIRSTILSSIARCLQAYEYPQAQEMEVQGYTIEILPKAPEPAKIPPSFQADFPKVMYPVRMIVSPTWFHKKNKKSNEPDNAKSSEMTASKQLRLMQEQRQKAAQQFRSAQPTNQESPNIVKTVQTKPSPADGLQSAQPVLSLPGDQNKPTQVDKVTTSASNLLNSVSGISGLGKLKINNSPVACLIPPVSKNSVFRLQEGQITYKTSFPSKSSSDSATRKTSTHTSTAKSSCVVGLTASTNPKDSTSSFNDVVMSPTTTAPAQTQIQGQPLKVISVLQSSVPVTTNSCHPSTSSTSVPVPNSTSLSMTSAVSTAVKHPVTTKSPADTVRTMQLIQNGEGMPRLVPLPDESGGSMPVVQFLPLKTVGAQVAVPAVSRAGAQLSTSVTTSSIPLSNKNIVHVAIPVMLPVIKAKTHGLAPNSKVNSNLPVTNSSLPPSNCLVAPTGSALNVNMGTKPVIRPVIYAPVSIQSKTQVTTANTTVPFSKSLPVSMTTVKTLKGPAGDGSLKTASTDIMSRRDSSVDNFLPKQVHNEAISRLQSEDNKCDPCNEETHVGVRLHCDSADIDAEKSHCVLKDLNNPKKEDLAQSKQNTQPENQNFHTDMPKPRIEVTDTSESRVIKKNRDNALESQGVQKVKDSASDSQGVQKQRIVQTGDTNTNSRITCTVSSSSGNCQVIRLYNSEGSDSNSAKLGEDKAEEQMKSPKPTAAGSVPSDIDSSLGSSSEISGEDETSQDIQSCINLESSSDGETADQEDTFYIDVEGVSGDERPKPNVVVINKDPPMKPKPKLLPRIKQVGLSEETQSITVNEGTSRSAITHSFREQMRRSQFRKDFHQLNQIVSGRKSVQRKAKIQILAEACALIEILKEEQTTLIAQMNSEKLRQRSLINKLRIAQDNNGSLAQSVSSEEPEIMQIDWEPKDQESNRPDCDSRLSTDSGKKVVESLTLEDGSCLQILMSEGESEMEESGEATPAQPVTETVSGPFTTNVRECVIYHCSMPEPDSSVELLEDTVSGLLNTGTKSNNDLDSEKATIKTGSQSLHNVLKTEQKSNVQYSVKLSSSSCDSAQTSQLDTGVKMPTEQDSQISSLETSAEEACNSTNKCAASTGVEEPSRECLVQMTESQKPLIKFNIQNLLPPSVKIPIERAGFQEIGELIKLKAANSSKPVTVENPNESVQDEGVEQSNLKSAKLASIDPRDQLKSAMYISNRKRRQLSSALNTSSIGRRTIGVKLQQPEVIDLESESEESIDPKEAEVHAKHCPNSIPPVILSVSSDESVPDVSASLPGVDGVQEYKSGSEECTNTDAGSPGPSDNLMILDVCSLADWSAL